MTYGNLNNDELKFIGKTFVTCSFPEFIMKMNLNGLNDNDIKNIFDSFENIKQSLLILLIF